MLHFLLQHPSSVRPSTDLPLEVGAVHGGFFALSIFCDLLASPLRFLGPFSFLRPLRRASLLLCFLTFLSFRDLYSNSGVAEVEWKKSHQGRGGRRDIKFAVGGKLIREQACKKARGGVSLFLSTFQIFAAAPTFPRPEGIIIMAVLREIVRILLMRKALNLKGPQMWRRRIRFVEPQGGGKRGKKG